MVGAVGLRLLCSCPDVGTWERYSKGRRAGGGEAVVWWERWRCLGTYPREKYLDWEGGQGRCVLSLGGWKEDKVDGRVGLPGHFCKYNALFGSSYGLWACGLPVLLCPLPLLSTSEFSDIDYY